MRKALLSIAGFDPSSGAGLLLDIRVFEHLGFRGTGVLTAATVQNTSRAYSVTPLASRLVRAQFKALARDIRIYGIKVGMLGTAANLRTVAGILAECPDLPRVVDPVLRASSGLPLLDPRAVGIFLGCFRGRASILTPNLDEASLLAGCPVRNLAAMKDAASRIYEAVEVPCLIKGGHLPGKAVDVLRDGSGFSILWHERVRRRVHGTGCFLSSGLLACLARGLDLAEACAAAIDLTVQAMKSARPSGKGRAVFMF